ncbi:stealth family protein [Herbiconiux sp. L3-i23]|uniref:stealth family protein n=1 Tax=Herbiconiux sp. L3-i23 TaxID=2905871 RepID=UPI002062AF0F|nr:stealth family protein [Herbiconiux sp. L3-i23]BDI22083.1 exopolysaccharide phosphotransferase CpsY [Herbiconiux sp. L3-i23]
MPEDKAASRPLIAVKPWNRVHTRADVAERDGFLTLVDQTVTPHEAMVDDLLFVRRALDDAGISFLLIRGNDQRPVLAVDETVYADVERALVEAGADEPFYAETFRPRDLTPKGAPVLLADGALSESRSPRIIRLYRPRLAQGGWLAYGRNAGVQLEVWRTRGSDVLVPVENALTRRSLPVEELVGASVERYGVTWPTIRHMFDELAGDVTFDIDIVFSWVDGTDKEFQRARAKRMASYVVGEGDDSEARFRQIDELKYALRSIYMYAPWIRNIYIATDSPRPVWLDEHPRVTLMRSEDFFEDLSNLPTHNSQAVEAQIHRIPGLSEYYLYSNDDMFFGRPVFPDMFFSPGGLTKFIEATTRIGLGENNPKRSGFENAARVNRRLLHERFGRVTTRHLEHTAAPLRKSVVEDLAREFPDEFRRTAASPFRAADNISVTNSLYHYYALMTGRAVQKVGAKVLYVDTTMKSGLRMLKKLLKKRDYDFFCLNDGSFPEVGPEERARKMRSFLERYFAIPAPWEKPVSTPVPAEKSAS